MDVNVLEILLRGIAIGALAAMTIGIWRDGAGKPARIAGVLFCISAACYAINASPPLIGAIGWLAPFVHIVAVGGAGFFWLFVMTLFEDRSISLKLLAPWTALTLIGAVGILLPPSEFRRTVWITHNLVQCAIAIHALIVIVRSWRGDLVEARRQLRGPFMAAVTLLLIAIAWGEVLGMFGFRPAWASALGAAALAAFCVAGAATFLAGRTDLLGPTLQAAATPVEIGLAPADRAALIKLETEMGAGEAWRREGLTIGALADEVGIPEHRLRRLINDQLGHRNFAAYVNARRIEAAKQRLRDAAHAQASVSTIAFDLGFGSLGPFNRAFKDATGVTPSEWRRQGSPISENPG